MFIRKQKNKNGSCSILLLTGDRIPGKKHPVAHMIKCFGTARDPNEINSLLEQAKAYKTNLELTAPKAKTLRVVYDLDVSSCRSYNTGFTDIYGQEFNSTFAKLGLKPTATQQLHDLVVMRIAAPASKLRTTHLSSEYGIDHKVDSIYKLMDKVTSPIITQIKKTVYDRTTQLLAEKKQTIDVLFYDLTTVYFETSSQDEIRDFGFSKDGKHQHVQIMLAVIVTKEGLPIDYKEFSGNSYEGHTLIPVLDEIKERYNIEKVVLVADAALMNAINLEELDRRKMKYIIAARVKNTNADLKKLIFNLDGYKSITKTIVDGELRDEIKAKIINSGVGDFVVAYHSTKRARKDEHDRQKILEKIEKYLHSSAKSKLTGCLKKTYVKISKGGTIELDEKKLSFEKQYDGFFGLRTNIKNADPLEFLASYRGLWQVEQTFRIAKNSLEIRPVFHYNPRRIRAHFAICYMALALVRYVEFILKRNGYATPHEQLHLILDRMRKVKIINHKNETFEFAEDPPIELIPVYRALHIKWPKKFVHKPNLL